MDENYSQELALAVLTAELASKLVELRKDARFNRVTWLNFRYAFKTAWKGLSIEETSKELVSE